MVREAQGVSVKTSVAAEPFYFTNIQKNAAYSCNKSKQWRAERYRKLLYMEDSRQVLQCVDIN